MSKSSKPSDIFVRRLREARELRNLNQGQLAQFSGLAPSAVSHFETGARKPSFDNLKRVADALQVTTDYLLGRVDEPEGLAGGERIHRHLEKLTGADRKFAEDMIRMLAKRVDKSRNQGVTTKPKNKFAVLAAERLIREFEIKEPPVDPVKIAENLGILVQPMPADSGVSGMLIRRGNEFCIGYATHIQSEGFKRFSIAHEIGHYVLPRHVDAVLAHEDSHNSRAGFATNDLFERQADAFASSLLMPDDMFVREMNSLDDGLEAVKSLSECFVTSLTAAAIRYVEKAQIPVAVVVSSDTKINYCFMSNSLLDFGLERLRKGLEIPEGTETRVFNEDGIKTGQICEDIDMRDWFGGDRSIPGTEEIMGLGNYGKTLTILSADSFAYDEKKTRSRPK